MWDGTDESAANLDRREPNSTTKPNAIRSRRRAPEPSRASQPIPLSPRRRERSRQPSPQALPTVRSRSDRSRRTPVTDLPKKAENQKSVRSDRPRTQARRRLEIVPSLPPRRPQPKKQIAPTPKRRSALAFLYGTRLLILGVGVGVIVGTSLSIWDPAAQFVGTQPTPEQSATPEPSPAIAALQLGEELAPLKAQIQSAIASQTQLAPGLMIVDPDTHAYVDINGSASIAAASTIKFPILVAFFQAVDEGKVRLDEPLTMRKELIATESGEMQYLPVGSRFPAIEVVTKMIDVSDNTATNMILDRLGGKEAVNQRFQSWGLTNTTIQNLLPDLEGTNLSSPQDMVSLLDAVNRGQLVSMRSHERMLDIMRKVANNSLIPQGLGQGATIAHKTGDIGTMLGDVGMIDLPNGKRYLMAAMVKRPQNDDRAGDVIRQMSKLTHQYFTQPNAAPASPTPQTDSQGAQPAQPTIAQP